MKNLRAPLYFSKGFITEILIRPRTLGIAHNRGEDIRFEIH